MQLANKKIKVRYPIHLIDLFEIVFCVYDMDESIDN